MISSLAYASDLTHEQAVQMAYCAEPRYGFLYFLPFWHFRNRETGQIHTFKRLWEGQAALARAMTAHPALFGLKAGKLGFSELECAYDGWVARFGPPNARVHLLSRDLTASRELLSWVKFGLQHLPAWMRLPVVEDEAGSNTSTSLKLCAGPEDTRTVVSYASGKDVSIDQTCQHLHGDEFTRWRFGETMWAAAQSTVSPFGGTCHLISRGRGRNWAGKVYLAARQGRITLPGGQRMTPFFTPYTQRPGRDEAWLEAQKESYTTGQLGQWAPSTWQQALSGDAGLVYPMFEEPEGRHVQHLATKYPLATCKRVGVGLDPGGGNPTAMTLIGERASWRTHQYDEFYRPGASSEDIAKQLFAWADAAEVHPSQLRVACDGSEPVLIATLADTYGFDAVAADKDRMFGIQLVQSRLNEDRHTYEPSCIHTIEEKYDYRWRTEQDAETRIEYAGDRPVKHHADAQDAERYILVDFAQYEAPAPLVLPRTGRRL